MHNNRDTTNIYLLVFLAFYAKNLIILPQIWIFCKKLTNFRSIQLEIIDYIFGNLWTTTVQNFTLMHKQIQIRRFFSTFLRFLHKIWLFSPIMFNFGHIKPDIIANIFCKVMEYPCTNFYTIWSSNINTTNIFQFFSIFVKNLIILPQICKILTYSTWHRRYYLYKSLWTTNVQNFTPMHKVMWIWQMFFNFYLFLQKMDYFALKCLI